MSELRLFGISALLLSREHPLLVAALIGNQVVVKCSTLPFDPWKQTFKSDGVKMGEGGLPFVLFQFSSQIFFHRR